MHILLYGCNKNLLVAFRSLFYFKGANDNAKPMGKKSKKEHIALSRGKLHYQCTSSFRKIVLNCASKTTTMQIKQIHNSCS